MIKKAVNYSVYGHITALKASPLPQNASSHTEIFFTVQIVKNWVMLQQDELQGGSAIDALLSYTARGTPAALGSASWDSVFCGTSSCMWLGRV